MNVPKLRFKEFTDEWKKEKFKDFSYYSGKRNRNNLPLIAYSITNTNGFVPQTEAHNEFGYMKNTDRTAYNIVTSNSFAYNPARINVGSIGYYSGKEDIIVSSLYEVFKLKNYINDKFIWYWLKSEKLPYWINKLQEGSVRQYFYYDKLCETFLYHPSLREQIKISNTLELLDKKIELQTKKIEALKLFKKGLFTNLKFNNTSLIKFKDILDEVNEKSVVNNQYEILSSTAHGLFLQKEYFNKQAASDINMGYKILRKNQLVLSPQNLWMGNININDKYNIGIVSPSYKIFKINANIINIDYFNNWIKSPRALYEYKISSEQGASVVRRNLNMDLFNEITLKIPNMQTQNKIGKQISNINNLIELENCKLVRLKKLKKGLMQCMFV